MKDMDWNQPKVSMEPSERHGLEALKARMEPSERHGLEAAESKYGTK